MRDLVRVWVLIAVIGMFAFLAGCHEPPKKGARVPDVTVVKPTEQDVTRYLEYTGTTQAIEYVDIRARVAGFLDKIAFEPRAKVKTGDLLFVIDPRQYEAQVKEAEAQVESRKAQYNLAKIDEDIAKSLEAKEAISWLKLQEATAKCDVAKADVDLTQAALDKSKLDLEYSRVTSPINGRVSRNLVDVGNLVGATEKTLLTTVVNDESVYCYFNMSELDLLSVRRAHPKAASAEEIKALKIPAELGLADEKGYPQSGIVDFTDTTVNPSTGTIQVRAVFPNQDGLLLAGMFARIRVPVEQRKGLLVPDVAIQFDQGGRFVLTVNDENTVEVKRIKMGQLVDALRVIEEGLALGDRVIVAGVQRARPGSKVNPQTPQAGSAQSGAAVPAKPQAK